MSKHNIIAGITTVLFLGAIIGLNLYSYLPATSWYVFSFNFLGHSIEANVNRNGLNDDGWEEGSKTRDVVFISFGLVLVSFVLACICVLITLVALFKRVHKKVRKSLFVMSILIFIANGLASLLFLRFNKAFCSDLDNGIPLPDGMGGLIDQALGDFCEKFKGDFGDNLITWYPGIGWYCEIVAFGISFFTIFLCSKILHTKKFGYHVIH